MPGCSPIDAGALAEGNDVEGVVETVVDDELVGAAATRCLRGADVFDEVQEDIHARAARHSAAPAQRRDGRGFAILDTRYETTRGSRFISTSSRAK